MKKDHLKLLSKDRATIKELLSKGSLKSRTLKRTLVLQELDKGHTYVHVQKIVGLTLKSIRSIANRYRERGLDCLYDAPRPGRPIEITVEQEDQITLLACEEAPAGYSQWSLRLLADKVVELGYCDEISHSQIRGILKKRKLNLT